MKETARLYAIRNKKTGKFLSYKGDWTSSLADARKFPPSLWHRFAIGSRYMGSDDEAVFVHATYEFDEKSSL